jgi:uncharacterized membrane protein
MATQQERYREGQIVGWTLRLGAYGSLTLIVIGLLLMLVHPGAGEVILRAGFLLLMFTPALRIIVAGLVFFREGDYKYALVSAVVLTVVVGTSVLALMGVLKNFER